MGFSARASSMYGATRGKRCSNPYGPAGPRTGGSGSASSGSSAAGGAAAAVALLGGGWGGGTGPVQSDRVRPRGAGAAAPRRSAVSLACCWPAAAAARWATPLPQPRRSGALVSGSSIPGRGLRSRLLLLLLLLQDAHGGSIPCGHLLFQLRPRPGCCCCCCCWRGATARQLSPAARSGIPHGSS